MVAEINTKNKSKQKLLLQTPKGTKDAGPREIAMKQEMIDKFCRIFQLHGAVRIETPTFELRQILCNKYGEESRLIYNLEDDDTSQQLSLRYDLTVPFSRYLCQNGIRTMRKYTYGKSYRRDNPSIASGRLREFYQCDFDIAGTSYPLVTEAECLFIVVSCLESIDLQKFTIIINDRNFLFAILKACKIPDEALNGVCASVDKLDKITREEFEKEMQEVRGIDIESCKTILSIFDYEYSVSNIEKLAENLEYTFGSLNDVMRDCIDNFSTLLDYCKAYGISERIRVSPKLARGLDYYTGLIFEVMPDKTYEVTCGSIAAGGRYDNLTKDMLPSMQTPCIGFSMGIERIYAILNSIRGESKTSPTQVLVCIASLDLEPKKCRELLITTQVKLLKANISCEISMKKRILDSFQKCESDKIEYALIFGQKEFEDDCIIVRDIATKEETKINKEKIVEYLNSKLSDL
ncbi:MAG: hypothetical protein MHMPM18_000724 [Marteilia pararefringens]